MNVDTRILSERRPAHPRIAESWGHCRVVCILVERGPGIPVCLFNPSAPGRPVIVVHGLQSHSGWFAQACRYIAERGHPVYAFDRMGSGLSCHHGGDLRHHADLAREIAKVIDFATSGSLDRRVHLLAHCYGAIPAALFASRHQDMIRSLVLASPAIYTNIYLGIRDRLSIMRSLLAGGTAQIPIPYPIELLTDQLDYLEFIRSDTLALRSLTSRFLLHVMLARLWLTLGMCILRIPVLVALAGRDRLAAIERPRHSFEGSQEVAFGYRYMGRPCTSWSSAQIGMHS
ncbi:MAG: alpha/beta fold hydrolase [Sedimentisphaerales bacterium]|jgi:alpha-beta hydrolase superfamily lysophospholipase|nr:alpha/beta fold hydrolase [Sedimentisphaerales bacterium]